jgi:hypothetical protein
VRGRRSAAASAGTPGRKGSERGQQGVRWQGLGPVLPWEGTLTLSSGLSSISKPPSAGRFLAPPPSPPGGSTPLTSPSASPAAAPPPPTETTADITRGCGVGRAAASQGACARRGATWSLEAAAPVCGRACRRVWQRWHARGLGAPARAGRRLTSGSGKNVGWCCGLACACAAPCCGPRPSRAIKPSLCRGAT